MHLRRTSLRQRTAARLTRIRWKAADLATSSPRQCLAHAAELVHRAHADLFAVDDLTRFEFKVFSQNGEDGVVVELLNRVGVGSRYFVEFGVQSGHEANCVLLADVFGWQGLFIEADTKQFESLEQKYRASRVTTRRETVTVDNVTTIFREAAVPKDLDVLSIDIDGNDLWVWQALADYRPRVVVIEYNAALPTDSRSVQVRADNARWVGTDAYGASLGALELLASDLGYVLVHTELTGVNAFFVRHDLASRVNVANPPRRNQNLGLVGDRHRHSRHGIEWTTFEASGVTNV